MNTTAKKTRENFRALTESYCQHEVALKAFMDARDGFQESIDNSLAERRKIIHEIAETWGVGKYLIYRNGHPYVLTIKKSVYGGQTAELDKLETVGHGTAL